MMTISPPSPAGTDAEATSPADDDHALPSEAAPADAPAAVDGSEAPFASAADAPADATLTDAATDYAADAPPASSADSPAEPRPAEMTAAACGAELGRRFPALFGRTPKPLKLRIQVDIQDRAPGVFTRRTLSAFLHRYTGSHAYLSAVAQGRQRFDLDGQPVAELSEEHREVAQAELARRRTNRDAQRALEAEQQALEEQQRRNRAGLLRDHETTTLTRANFCALKGVAEAELDGLLARAREEAIERRRAAPPPHRPPGRGPGPGAAPGARSGPGPRPSPSRPRSGPPR